MFWAENFAIQISVSRIFPDLFPRLYHLSYDKRGNFNFLFVEKNFLYRGQPRVQEPTVVSLPFIPQPNRHRMIEAR